MKPVAEIFFTSPPDRSPPSAPSPLLWPLISQMNPDASTLALASTEIDIGAIPAGQIVTVKWRGKPVFIRHRTPEEIKAAEARRRREHARSRRRTSRACRSRNG